MCGCSLYSAFAASTRQSSARHAARDSASSSHTKFCEHDRTHVDPIFHMAGISADTIFSSLLNAHPAPATAAIVEVGVYDGNQCVASSRAGFQPVICFEPSPQNYERSRATIEAAGVMDDVTLVKKAVGNKANQEVTLHAKGGSGDHLGEVPFAGETDRGFQASEVSTIESTSLDAYLQNITYSGSIYIVKVDTQGFDGLVIEGMEGLLLDQRIDYVLFELWPKAMLHEGRKSCTETLHFLTSFGYRLYELAMPGLIFEIGGAAPDIGKSLFTRGSSIKQVCEWYESSELSNTFGTWTDVLAVSPLRAL